MCFPMGPASTALLNFGSQAASTVQEFRTQKQNYKYRTQIALNNAKMANDEALRQKQLGIENSRIEKINGIREVNKVLAQNSASNLDSMSLTNRYSYDDLIDSSNLKANSIKNKYDTISDSYLNRANGYLNDLNEYKKQYNNSLFDFSLNALGKIGKVSNEWYSLRQPKGLENGYI